MKKIKLWIVREADTLAFSYADKIFEGRHNAEVLYKLLGRQLGVYTALMSITVDREIDLEDFITEEFEYLNVWEFPTRFNPKIIKQK